LLSSGVSIPAIRHFSPFSQPVSPSTRQVTPRSARAPPLQVGMERYCKGRFAGLTATERGMTSWPPAMTRGSSGSFTAARLRPASRSAAKGDAKAMAQATRSSGQNRDWRRRFGRPPKSRRGEEVEPRGRRDKLRCRDRGFEAMPRR
jgi:hypothetical protein